jgi:hypothetical protein
MIKNKNSVSIHHLSQLRLVFYGTNLFQNGYIAPKTPLSCENSVNANRTCNQSISAASQGDTYLESEATEIYAFYFKYAIYNNMLFIIIMINLESSERVNPVDRAIRRVKAMMMNWGLGEGCSFIYAVLITAHKPLSADEIGKKTNYAYSSTINYLNTLIRLRRSGRG